MYVLTDLFGNCPHVKIIEVLAENAGFDISRPEIHSEIGGAKTTVYSHIERLVKGGFVNKTRKVGRTQLYSLNLNDPRTRLVVYLENLIVTGRLEKTMGRLGIPSIPEAKPMRAPLDLEEVFLQLDIERFQISSNLGPFQISSNSGPFQISSNLGERITIVHGTVEHFAEEAKAAGAMLKLTTESALVRSELEPAPQNAA